MKEMKGKYKEDATYKVDFKDDDAKRNYWTHMHCILVDSFGPDYKKRCGVVYQLMSLYEDIEHLYEDVEHFGKAYGGFLNYIKELSPQALKFLEISEIKEG